MRNKFKISVVIPLYNKAEFINNCLHSVVKQTVCPAEIIVVDDGSTDNGVDIVESIQCEQLTIIRQKNSGVSAARNAGIKAAQCEFIAFLDADDAWLPGHIEELMRLAGKYPEVDIWATGYNWKIGSVDRVYSIETPDQKYSLESYVDHILGNKDLVWTSAAMVRKSATLEVGGFMDGYNHGEDHALWLTMVMQGGGVAVSGEVSAIYNQTSGSLSQRLVVQPDAVMVSIDRELKVRNDYEPSILGKLKDLKAKYALGHAIGALKKDDLVVATQFVDMAKGSRRHNKKRLAIRILITLSGFGLKFVARWGLK